MNEETPDGPSPRDRPPPAPERVLAGYCHDLNGQLATAMGWISLLGPDVEEGGPREQLQGAMERMELLLRELRWLVRDEERIAEPVSLVDLLDTASSALRQHPRFHDAVVERHGPADLPAVRTHFPSALRTLLLAADAAQAGERVRAVPLRIEVGDGTVRLAFAGGTSAAPGAREALEREAAEGGIGLVGDPDGTTVWLEMKTLG